MKRHSSAHAIFAMVVVAFLFGLAPVFHAVCVSALGQSSHSMTHVMADGTVMNMSTDISAAPMIMDSASSDSHVMVVSETDIEEANLLGHVMITAGLTLLTFIGLRFCKLAIARGRLIALPRPARLVSTTGSRARARPPTQVDLNTLCISRT